MNPEDHAKKAADILKQRGSKLGSYKVLYEQIAQVFHIYLESQGKLKPGQKFEATDAVEFLKIMKMIREWLGHADPDHGYDLANYVFLKMGLTKYDKRS